MEGCIEIPERKGITMKNIKISSGKSNYSFIPVICCSKEYVSSKGNACEKLNIQNKHSYAGKGSINL